MFSLFNRNKSTAGVPEWAGRMTSRNFARFESDLHDYFKKKGIPIQLGDGFITLEEHHYGVEQLGLSNLVQLCNQKHPAVYRRIIKDHFEGMASANAREREMDALIADFTRVKPYLAVKLYPEEQIDTLGKDQLMCERVAGDLFQVLVFDFPESVASVQPGQAALWNVPPKELFAIGRDHVKHKYPAEISEQDLVDFKIWFAQSEHFYATNVLLELEEHPDFLGPHGALVAAPHRHAAIAYPIASLEVATAVNKLIPVIYGMHQEGPGSLSNKLFWFHNGSFSDLPYRVEEGKISFIPPPDFVEMVNGLKE